MISLILALAASSPVLDGHLHVACEAQRCIVRDRHGTRLGSYQSDDTGRTVYKNPRGDTVAKTETRNGSIRITRPH